ncbi:MAG: manganese efflux pump [Oscillospiraceae bacterium]|nr:manganese efflux pump [Oscillospiraceae bacterium]
MLKTLLLIFAVSIDGFAAAMGLGAAGIKVPLRSSAVISLIGTLFLTVPVCFADVVGDFIPEALCRIISSSILVILGILNLFHGAIKRAAEKRNSSEQIRLYFDGTAADRDNSKTISCREALALSVALSADSLVTGVSAGLGQLSAAPLALLAFGIGFLSIEAGTVLGRHMVSAHNVNLQWLCGLILIAVAFVG